MIVSPWYLTDISAALLSRSLLNVRAIAKSIPESHGFETSRDFAVRRPSDLWIEALVMDNIAEPGYPSNYTSQSNCKPHPAFGVSLHHTLAKRGRSEEFKKTKIVNTHGWKNGFVRTQWTGFAFDFVRSNSAFTLCYSIHFKFIGLIGEGNTGMWITFHCTFYAKTKIKDG